MKQFQKKLKLSASLLSLGFVAACGSQPVLINTEGVDLDPLDPDVIPMAPMVYHDPDSWYKPINSSEDKLIHKLVKEGKVAELSSILAQGYKTSTANSYGVTAFQTMADYWYSYDNSTKKQLLAVMTKYNVDFMSANNMGTRPLIIALERGYDDLYQHLIQLGDNVSIPSKDRNGNDVYPILRAAANGNLKSFKHCITQNSDIYIQDYRGRNSADMIIEGIGKGSVTIDKLEHILDMGYPLIDHIHDKPDGLIDAFEIFYNQGENVQKSDQYFMNNNRNYTKAIEFLDNLGLSFSRVVHRNTLETLYHKAAAFNNVELLDLLIDKGFKGWSLENSQGATSKDYAMIYRADKAVSKLDSLGVHSTLDSISRADLGKDLDALIQKIALNDVSRPTPLTDDQVKAFYSMFPELPKPSYDTGRTPVVVITGVTNQKTRSINHLNDTITVVEGTSKRLSSHTSSTQITGFKSNPVNRENLYLRSNWTNNPTLLMVAIYENINKNNGAMIGSHSVNYSFEYFTQEALRRLYQQTIVTKPSYKDDYFLRLNPIIHLSNGNNGKKSCTLLDTEHDRQTCFRGPKAMRFSSRSVHVGAAEAQDDGNWIVHWYSDNSPTYCAPLPLETNGDVFLGTSFSAPASAAIEAELTRLHGRSGRFASGVTHEDIMLALQVSADRNVIDQRSGQPLIFQNNGSGIGMSERCGAGVVRAGKAHLVLQDIVNATLSGQAQPTQMNSHEINVSTKNPSLSHAKLLSQTQDEYVYEITVPQSGYITKPYVLLSFEYENKGAAVFVSPRGTKSYIRPSLAGHADTDEFSGEFWQQGEKLLVITTKPLKSDQDTRAILRLAPPDSAFGYLVKNRAAILNRVNAASSAPASKPRTGTEPTIG